MARTNVKKDSYYFSHDCGSSRDLKIIKLRRKYGWAGYGIFWAVVEKLRETSDFKIPVEQIDDLLFDLGIDKDVFDYLFTCKLLVKNNDEFYSNSLIARMDMKKEISEKMRANGKQGGRPKKTKKVKDKIVEIENPIIPKTDGSINHSGGKIQEFITAIGAFTVSEIEKSNISSLIDRGCIADDVKSAKKKSPDYVKGFKNENTLRNIITEMEIRKGNEPMTDEELRAYAKTL